MELLKVVRNEVVGGSTLDLVVVEGLVTVMCIVDLLIDHILEEAPTLFS